MRRLRVRSLGVAIVLMMVAFVGPPAIGGEVGIVKVQRLIDRATDSNRATTLELRSLNHLTLTLHDAVTSLDEPGRAVAGDVERWAQLDEAFSTAQKHSSGSSVQSLAKATAEYRQARAHLERPGGDAGRIAARRDLAAAVRMTLRVADRRNQTIPALISPLEKTAREQQQGIIAGALGTLLVALAMALWLRRSVQRPLRSLKAASRQVKAGDFQAVDVRGLRDFEPIVEAFNEMAKQLETDRTELVEMAYHDHLTGLANRSLFFVEVNAMLAEDRGFCVLFIDLDGFKSINDTHGHAAGDQVLIDLSERLKKALRPTDSLARLGGDEFAVLLRGTASRPEAARIADRLHLALATPLFVHDAALFVGASIGIAVSDGVTTASEIVIEADHAMYAVKQASPRSGPFSQVDGGPSDGLQPIPR